MTGPETQQQRLARLEARVAELEHEQTVAAAQLLALEATILPETPRWTLERQLLVSQRLLALRGTLGLGTRIVALAGTLPRRSLRLVQGDDGSAA